MISGEARAVDDWGDPNHVGIRASAHVLSAGKFLVLGHDQNTSSFLAKRDLGPKCEGRERAAVFAAFGLAGEPVAS